MSSPGRYQRSFSGLLASMLVLLLCVAAYVGFRALTRQDMSVHPDAINQAEPIQLAHDADLTVLYPEPLPTGWVTTNYTLIAGPLPVWGLSMLTEEGRYVGLRHERRSESDLAHEWIDEAATETSAVQVASGDLAGTWQGWQDSGGDRGITREWQGQTVMVWGAVDEATLLELASRLRA